MCDRKFFKNYYLFCFRYRKPRPGQHTCSLVCFPWTKPANVSHNPAIEVKNPLAIDTKLIALYPSTTLENLILTRIPCRVVRHANVYFLFAGSFGDQALPCHETAGVLFFPAWQSFAASAPFGGPPVSAGRSCAYRHLYAKRGWAAYGKQPWGPQCVADKEALSHSISPSDVSHDWKSSMYQSNLFSQTAHFSSCGKCIAYSKTSLLKHTGN